MTTLICKWNNQYKDMNTLTAIELCVPTEAPMTTLPVSMETATSDDVSAETTEPPSGVLGKSKYRLQ